MGIDCGFDIDPRLEATDANKETYRKFLDEIIQTYKDVYDEDSRSDDKKLLEMPTDSDPLINFTVGEYPNMPSNPDHCNYFLRFSSKISGSCGAAQKYIDDVYEIAKKYFGRKVHYWYDAIDFCEELEPSYSWMEVNDAAEELRVLVTKAEKEQGKGDRGSEKQEGELESADRPVLGPSSS
jgi:hypothetical protein